MKEKILKVLSVIFGYGITISLFAGGLSFFGFLAALIIGGETATEICTFIYKEYYPAVFIATSIVILLGLIRIYLSGEHAFMSSTKGRSAKKKQG